MSKRKLIGVAAALSALAANRTAAEPPAKNVIFIIADDLNSSVEKTGGHPQAYTPNLDRLAKMGVRFVNAHCNAPMCAPSRPSLLSGLYPSTTGLYAGTPKFRTLPALKNAVLFPRHLSGHGYQCYAAGKIFHDIDLDNTVFGASKADGYDGGFIGPIANFGPYPWDGKTTEWERPSREIVNPDLPWFTEKPWSYGFGRLSRLPEKSTSWVYSDGGFMGADGKNGGLFKYNGASDRSLMPDEIIANWAVDLLSGTPTFSYGHDLRRHTTRPLDRSPFFIGIGLVKTHVALYVPDEFYDAVLQANRMTENDVVLPWTRNGEVKFGDLEDIPKDLRGEYSAGRQRYAVLEQAGKEYRGGLTGLLKDITMAYLAGAYEIDVQVGKILDALEASGRIKDTVIIFTSDHGFNNGDKESFFKYLLWEGSTRVPFIVYDPSPEFDASRGKICEAPVSLIDIYPTVLDLCGLAPKTGLDGHSIRPLLAAPEKEEWAGPPVALTVVEGNWQNREVSQQNFSVRSKHFRYSLGWRGGEELYDHRTDPHEWVNLAGNPRYKTVQDQLKSELLRLTGRAGSPVQN